MLNFINWVLLREKYHPALFSHLRTPDQSVCEVGVIIDFGKVKQISDTAPQVQLHRKGVVDDQKPFSLKHTYALKLNQT